MSTSCRALAFAAALACATAASGQVTTPPPGSPVRQAIMDAMRVMAGDDRALTELSPDDEAATLAVNSGEHYLPLLYAAGARLPGDEAGLFNDTLDGALTMTSVLYGDAGLLTGIA